MAKTFGTRTEPTVLLVVSLLYPPPPPPLCLNTRWVLVSSSDRWYLA